MENLSNRSKKKIESIVMQASRLFVQHGYHKVTMESIAQYANVSKVTLYKYFRDKQVLYEHILKEIYLEEFNEVISIIDSRIPYEEKIHQVVLARIKKYYDKSKPVFNNEITLGYEVQQFIKKHAAKMKKYRAKLYNQGRMEEYICDDVSDETLELYFSVIQHGLVNVFKDSYEMDNEKVTELLDLLYSGVLRCQK